jgi:hypothetical protein
VIVARAVSLSSVGEGWGEEVQMELGGMVGDIPCRRKTEREGGKGRGEEGVTKNSIKKILRLQQRAMITE